MSPVLSNVRQLLWYMLAWLLMGGVIAKLLVASKLAAWANALFFAIPVSITCGFMAASAYYVCRSLPFRQRRFFLACAVFGGTSLISGFFLLSLCQLWNYLGLSIGESWAGITLSPNLSILILIAGSVFYLCSILAHDVLIAFDNVRTAERREADSQVLARDAELQVLRSQINPHFLFNSLNSISALTTIDAAGARSMTIELANFYRQTLALSEKKLVMLKDEISLCQNFLAIEKIRFGKKLQVTIDIDEAAMACLIPPMVLQPLVENAIKHGIRDLADGGTLLIKSLVRDHWLHISIQNPVDAQPSATSGNGTGLKNLQARFASIYGDKARVSYAKTADNFVVEMALPVAFSD
ncbi:MAG: histidine kinase [Undibacterium sp.]|nr:histidine kinase [Undibacterium sp.]